MTRSSHLRINAPRRAARRSAFAAAGLPEPVSCHQRLRGPYSGVAPMLRAVVPEAYRRWPGLVDAHRIVLLYTVPELAEVIGQAPPSLVDDTPHEERTRYFGASLIRATSQGVITFLQEHARQLAGAAGAPGPVLTLAFDDADQAEPTEQEFLALLLRRADPEQLRIAVGTAAEPALPELAEALRHWTRPLPLPPLPVPPVEDPAAGEGGAAPRRSTEELARAHVWSEGTGDDPEELAGYAAAEPRLRARLHDERADELEAGADRGVLLGALPYHRERGSDPGGAGRRALRTALEISVAVGYSTATIDLGHRGRAVCDPELHQLDYCHFSAKAASALVPIGEPEECEAIYTELRRRYTLPRVQMTCSYALAILYTRFFRPPDHEKALELANNARALAELETDPVLGPVYQVFQDNGLALIEMRRGHLDRSLRLVSDGIRRLDAELPGDRYLVHRTQLLHNRARVLVALGRIEEALADYAKLLAWDPAFVEYHTDRAALLRRQGDLPGALADYDRAIAVSAPLPELFYNRANLRDQLGDVAGALADLRYVLEMEPAETEARLNLTALLLELGEPGEAAELAAAGLQLRPEEPRLLCTAGSAAHALGEFDQARQAFDRALAVDAAFGPALVNRAVLSYEQGELDSAIGDLTAALELTGDDPDVLHNRGVALQEAGRHAEAVRDYGRALELPGADRAELLRRRAWCLTALGRAEAAEADLRACLDLGPGPDTAQLEQLLERLAADRSPLLSGPGSEGA
ncbi:tetratricopeptide repeat protein [Kitasatospora sp. NBC_01287]|uniref:tetratricopeptide repeat protein n=1 Tax=Kitasatospora sp. NBC_01287 TaxID=2903573 RepID=UPI00224CE38B|nr:tetratricopeptide repeat protein [Kitasatospora sp. NBC_01287]MCX4751648.1 tetratricopeptide repeat protein [Kitasatospora sp. NBC_01287]